MKADKIKSKVMVHGHFYYWCDKCHKKWQIYLECGVEQCNYNCSSPKCAGCNRKVIPSPFMALCSCGGLAQHYNPRYDRKYRKQIYVDGDKVSYFKYDLAGVEAGNEYACGIPVIKPTEEM
jgi:hypothetical protein